MVEKLGIYNEECIKCGKEFEVETADWEDGDIEICPHCGEIYKLELTLTLVSTDSNIHERIKKCKFKKDFYCKHSKKKLDEDLNECRDCITHLAISNMSIFLV